MFNVLRILQQSGSKLHLQSPITHVDYFQNGVDSGRKFFKDRDDRGPGKKKELSKNSLTRLLLLVEFIVRRNTQFCVVKILTLFFLSVLFSCLTLDKNFWKP